MCFSIHFIILHTHYAISELALFEYIKHEILLVDISPSVRARCTHYLNTRYLNIHRTQLLQGYNNWYKNLSLGSAGYSPLQWKQRTRQGSERRHGKKKCKHNHQKFNNYGSFADKGLDQHYYWKWKSTSLRLIFNKRR